MTLTNTGNQLVPSGSGPGISGDVVVDTGAVLAGTRLELKSSGTQVTVDGTLSVLTDLTLADGADLVVNGTLDLDGTLTQTVSATAPGSTITVNGELAKSSTSPATIESANGLGLDVNEGAIIDADGGSLGIEAAGTWTGGVSGIDFAVEDPATVTWGGDQDLTGTFGGSFTTTAGTVTLIGTKTATGATTFGLPDNMLFIDGATLAGASPFTIDTVVDVDDATLTADVTIASPSGELGVASGNITVDGTLTNDNAITGTGLTILFDGTGTIDNNGTITTTENGLFDLFGPTLLSDPLSTLDVRDDSSFTINTTYTELGRTRVEPGAIAGFYGPTTTFDTGSTVELIIDGSSAFTQDNGQIDVDNGAALTLNGTLETTEVGYTPTSADDYIAITCNVGTCPTFPTASIGGLTQAAVGTNLVLQGPLCDTEWTNGGGDDLWSNAANWTAGVPTATDAVCVDLGGGSTVTVDGTQEILRFETAAEDLDITGTLTVNDTSSIDGAVSVSGDLVAAGDVVINTSLDTDSGANLDGLVTIANGATADLGTGGGSTFVGGVGGIFTNNGTTTLVDDFLIITDGADIDNNGTIVVGNASQSLSAQAPGSVFTNNAVIRKDGTGGVNIDAAQGLAFDMTQGSALVATGGTLNILAGGTWTAGTGIDLQVDAGATLQWQGDQAVSGTFTGSFGTTSPGKVRMTGIKTSNTSTTLDFPESPLNPGFANAYQLEWDGVELRGDDWVVDGFVRTWLTSSSGIPQATITADVTLNGEIAQQSPEVQINAATFTNDGLYRAIGSAFDSLTGTGTWENNGTFRRQSPSGSSAFTVSIGTWTSSTTSVIEIVDNGSATSTLQINNGYTESGLVSVEANTNFAMGGTGSFDSDSVVDIEITGDSTTTENYGTLSLGSTAFGGELRTSGAYVPAFPDAYTVATCTGACPTWPTTSIGGLQQVLVAGDVVLQAPNPEPANKLLSGSGDAGDLFGYSIAVDGNRMAVGAPQIIGGVGSGEDGAVFIFTRANESAPWVFDQRIDNPNDDATGNVDDQFGWDVDLSGEWLVAGAPGENGDGDDRAGRVYVINLDSPQTVTLTRPDFDSSDFGFSVAIDGSYLVVGTPGLNASPGSDIGAAYIYEFSGGTWNQLSNVIEGSIALQQLGASVAIDGDLIAVGADTSAEVGFVETYELVGTTWQPTSDPVISDGGIGERFGAAVDISNGRLIVGAPNLGSGGAASIWERDGDGVWQQLDLLPAVGLGGTDSFGDEVSIDGGIAVVGAPARNVFQGASFVFTYVGGEWVPTSVLEASDGGPVDFFGQDVEVQGGSILVGAARDDNSSGVEAGAVYSFTETPGAPFSNQLITQDAAAGDFQGQSVDMHEDWMVVGSRSRRQRRRCRLRRGLRVHSQRRPALGALRHTGVADSDGQRVVRAVGLDRGDLPRARRRPRQRRHRGRCSGLPRRRRRLRVPVPLRLLDPLVGSDPDRPRARRLLRGLRFRRRPRSADVGVPPTAATP